MQTVLVNSTAEGVGGNQEVMEKNTFCFPCWNVNGWSDLWWTGARPVWVFLFGRPSVGQHDGELMSAAT